MQEIFRVGPPLLGDAANANDLSDLFATCKNPLGVSRLKATSRNSEAFPIAQLIKRR
jgi:hypothetical protein